MKPPRSGHGFALALLGVAVVLAIAVVVALSAEEEPGSGPTPTPGVFAAPLELALVPPGSDELQRQITEDIGDVLAELYERAFVPQASEATPSPTGVASSRIRPLFTKKAAAALRKDPDVFERAGDLTITRGRVTFGGLATLESNRPIQALLEVVFDATATPEQRVSPLVRVRQRGTILLVYRPNQQRWFVDGFDLRFATDPVTPTPSAP